MTVIQEYLDIIKEECNKRGLNEEIAIAIYCHMVNETGHWKSKLWTNDFNPAGIKSTKSWVESGGQVVNYKTQEDYGNGLVTITDGFRKYPNAKSGIVDGYFGILSLKRYEPARKSTTAYEFIEQLRICGWWTSKTAENTVKKLYDEFKKGTTIAKEQFTVSKEMSKLLQFFLNIVLPQNELEVDGIIGPKTKAKLVEFVEKLCG